MHVRSLGWAGIEISAGDHTLVVDPLLDTGAVFAGLGAGGVPEVVSPTAGRAVAGLLTHLHRDHADADALEAALAPAGFVAHPTPWPGGEGDDLGVAQAEAELAASGLERRPVSAWSALEAGPFSLTALPALDGVGDHQVSWLVEAEGRRVLHLGDTAFHSLWWRIAHRHGPFDVVFAPVNGAMVSFPHRRPASPLPAAMTPEQAAAAGELLGARTVIPMHAEGYELDPYYLPVREPTSRFVEASADRPYETRVLAPGEAIDL